MTRRKKKLLLDLLGALVSLALPAAAAISQFPRLQEATAGESSFLSALNLSCTAFAVVCIIAVITAGRFLRDRVHMPKSGLVPSVLLYAVLRGVRMIILPFETILFYAVIGNAIAAVLYLIADKRYGEVSA
jgi:hypothetical protein